MPIYEYECDACSHRFELLVLPHSPETRTCPSCKGGQVHKLLSLFAVDSEATRLSNKNHGRKLAKKDIMEQRHADMQHVIEHHREHNTGE